MDKKLTNSIQLNWLRTFEVAARELSFTLAAQELNMSQSAVSQQIQLLEHHLNNRLFVRANRSIQLSDTGRAFLPMVQNAMRQLNVGANQIFSPLNASVVDISVNTAFSVLWLAPHLANFHAVYPQIMVRQSGNNWDADFERSTAELEIRYGQGDWPGFDVYPLITPRLRPYCSSENARRLSSPNDLVMPLLDVIGIPDGWDKWLEHMNLTHLLEQPRHYMDSHAAAVTMAANGFGICLMYDDMMQTGTLAQQLSAPFIDSITTSGTYYLCHRQGENLSQASEVFRDWLLNLSGYNNTQVAS